jgi:4-aminobutyrate aminotransferase
MNDKLRNAEITQRRMAATPRGVGVLANFYAARARNAELWDVEGHRYIDFASGIAVLNVGHSHPRVTAAVARQLECFTHTAYQIVPYESYVRLAERLCALAPAPYAKKATFFSSGAEAVENAIKIARAATGRAGVIAFSGGFHGRTMLGMALTGKIAPYKLSFGPFPAEVYHAPFPCALHGVSVEDSLKAVEHLFKSDIDPKRLAAFIFEPVQGEGGFYVAPSRWVRALREICDRHGILLIADEIQTGFARTGKMFAMEWHAVHADLMTVAKSIGGGLPLSGVIGRAEVMDAAEPGGLGGTYAGNPLAIAAAHAVLDVLEEERLCERSEKLGARLSAALEGIRSSVPHLREVRSQGSMIAAEFFTLDGKGPDPTFTKRVQEAAMARGLILLTCGIHGNVIRFLYPLTIEDAIFEEGLGILRDSLIHAAGSAKGPKVEPTIRMKSRRLVKSSSRASGVKGRGTGSMSTSR